MLTYKSILLSIFLSTFIYLEYFNISIKWLDTFFVLSGFILLFKLSKKELFSSGFLIGILWFWWISYSFIHYELSYLIPIIIISIASIYGLLFYFIGFFKNIYLKILYIFSISFIEPFQFNWFKIELPLINSYLGTSKLEFLILLIITALLIQYRDSYTKLSIFGYMSIITILYFYNINSKVVINKPDLKIYEYQTSLSQDIKWDIKYKKDIVNDNLTVIKNAISNNYDIIILPETAFPLILNNQENIMKELLIYSKKISIVLGSLYQENEKYYNSTYLFSNNNMQVAHKVVLVPFGEAVPFPEKIRDWINNTFYNGAQDYITATKATTFNINGIKFRNAICYEATTDDIYTNLDTNYVIAISNNAWFTPSIQPTLQKLLMKYYSFKYDLLIYNVTNK
ncbi:MAG: apolipoprotein N-acyltransferase [Campylobacterota bacterium]|nr:apolipoprotein N-acyltransferase [Campylobacterota bacterium]